jgi:DNA-binding transcriptional ArsR family regulator
MAEIAYLRSLKHSLWHLLAGTRGGITRIRIIELLRERPYNTNQLREKLSLDYKTIQHHIKVLLDADIITCSDKSKYGSMYFLSPLLEENLQLFNEILEKTGETKLNKKGKNQG